MKNPNSPTWFADNVDDHFLYVLSELIKIYGHDGDHWCSTELFDFALSVSPYDYERPDLTPYESEPRSANLLYDYVSFSIVVPTHDGEQLERFLLSVDYQLGDNDEVIIIGDTFGGTKRLEHVRKSIEKRDDRYKYVELNAGYMGWGHPQRNFGMKLASKSHIISMDDDDILRSGILHEMRYKLEVTYRNSPVLFRFQDHRAGHTYWIKPIVVKNNVGGRCLVVPNVKERLGKWTDEYTGDFDFVKETLEKWDNDFFWDDEVIADAAVP